MKNLQEVIENATPVTVKKCYGPVLEELAEYTNEPIEVVYEKVRDAFKAQSIIWQMWKGSPEEYYRKCRVYPYDLADFSSLRVYQSIAAPLKFIKGKNVIDMGCGIGTIAIQLANQGNTVLKSTAFIMFTSRIYP